VTIFSPSTGVMHEPARFEPGALPWTGNRGLHDDAPVPSSPERHLSGQVIDERTGRQASEGGTLDASAPRSSTSLQYLGGTSEYLGYLGTALSQVVSGGVQSPSTPKTPIFHSPVSWFPEVPEVPPRYPRYPRFPEVPPRYPRFPRRYPRFPEVPEVPEVPRGSRGTPRFPSNSESLLLRHLPRKYPSLFRQVQLR